MKEYSVAIIILNWNGEKDTIACLESLKKINYPNHKFFLVDNNSEAKSQKILEEYLLKNSDLKIEFIKNQRNAGFSAGNNVALKKSFKDGFDYFLLLNNDTEVKEDFLDKLIKVARDNEKSGLVAPKIYFYDEPNVIWHAVCKFSWLGGGRPLQYGEVDKNPKESKIKKTQYVSGCAVLIKKEVIEKIGYLEEDFFMYYEDTDFSLRAKKAGFELLYAPSSHIWHKVSRSTFKAMTRPEIHYYHVRNALLLSKRNAPLFVLWGVYFWSLYLYLKQILKFIVIPKKRESALMIMCGIRDFYKGKFGKL